jgi:hypothetical protein
MDAIGVPRGVPDGFKARNQIAAGFESAVFCRSTINKNVDWINYIYYNQQQCINNTRSAVKGIAEQLGPTSKMFHIHPRNHRSKFDHNQGSPRPDRPVKRTG